MTYNADHVDLQCIRVILIDDDEDDFILVRTILKRIPNLVFEVTWVKNAEAGINAIRDSLADIYFVDYLLGHESGLSVLQAAQQWGNRAPLILLTGQGNPTVDSAALAAGAADYLVKRELDAVRLDRTIRYALERAKTRGALEDSETRYRLLFERNPLPMLVYALGTFQLLAVNESAIDHYGYSKGEFLAMALVDICSPDDRELFNLLNQRSPEGLTRAGLWRHLRKDHSIIDVEIAEHSLVFAGQDARMVLVNDVTEKIRAERALREREIQLRQIVSDTADALFVIEKNQQIVFANAAAGRLLHTEADDLLGQQFEIPLPMSQGDYTELTLDMQGVSRVIEMRSSETVWSGSEALLISIRDVTDRNRVEEQLRLLRRAVDSALNGVVIADARIENYPLIYVNDGFERITGYSAEESIGRNCSFLQGNDHTQPEVEVLRQALTNHGACQVVLRNFRKDGSMFWNQLSIAPVRNEQGIVTHFVGALYDITERRRYEAELAYLAVHDAVTGVPRYIAIEEYTRQLIADAGKTGKRVIIFYLDIDRFHVVNEGMGHAIGDQALRSIAERICQVLGDQGRVSRIAGDEFVIVHTPSQNDDGMQLADQFRRAIEVPIAVPPYSVYLTCSIGISTFPDTARNAAELLNQAEAAMSRAKRLGHNSVQKFSGEQLQELADRLSLGSRLRDAVRKNELLLYYQPQVSAQNGQISGVEALVRWQSPELGFLPPGRFIRVAEELGLMVEIGNWVLENACQQAMEWIHMGIPEFTLAVNVSAVQLHRPSFVDEVQRALEKTGFPAKHLELELTESSIMENVYRMAETMHALRDIGVRLALDDFGVGYSSLSYLKRFPIAKLKIDQSFVHDIARDSGDAGISRAIIAMGHQLGMIVMAEGVETASQAGYLRRNHCDLLQGILLSGPVTAEKATELIKQRYLAKELFTSGGDERTLLLLDDEENILRALTRLLRRDGYQILTTTSAREAFEMLGRQRVQVVISDQRMPEINGTEFLSQVRMLYPDTVRLVLSGYTDLRTVTEAINKGSIYKFLTKPWDDEELRKEVREAFRTYSERERSS